MMNKKVIVGIIMLLVGWGLTVLADEVIHKYFPVRPVPDDIFFRLTPYVPLLSYASDAIVVAGLAIALFMFRKSPDKIGNYAIALGLMWSFRAFMNVLTPLGDPSGDTVPYGFLETTPSYAMFPSGHIGGLGVAYFLLQYYGEKKASYLLLVLLVAEFITMIMTRGHYSIDMVAGFMLSYIVYRLVLRFTKNMV